MNSRPMMSLTLSLKRPKLLLGVALALIPWVALVAAPKRWVKPEAAKDYREGLAIWRKPGKTPDHAACASCHGPDGLEIAAYNFDDANIRRRAAIHISPEDADKVVAMIHAEREMLGLKILLDPMKDRPFQPGGEVLPGATPEERDNALGVELEP